MLHHRDGDARPEIGDGGGHDEGDLALLEQPSAVCDSRELWELLPETLQRMRLALRVPAGAFAPEVEQTAHLIEDVRVVDSDHAEFKRDRTYHRSLTASG